MRLKIMNNKSTFLIVVVILSMLALGCSSLNPFSGSSSGSSSNDNKTLTDKAVDTAVGESKIGVPECDEVMDLINAEMNNPDDNFITKAAKQTILNRIKDGIRDSVEQNKTDKAEMAKTCKEFKKQFEKYKAEQKANSNTSK
jgi:hypothetical protein